jgi:hypothetical protein
MDVSAITTFVSSVGFPIAIAIYLVVVQRQDIEKLREEITKLRIAIILLAKEAGVDVTDDGGDHVNLLD